MRTGIGLKQVHGAPLPRQEAAFVESDHRSSRPTAVFAPHDPGYPKADSTAEARTRLKLRAQDSVEAPWDFWMDFRKSSAAVRRV
jgi:hypothetical protein